MEHTSECPPTVAAPDACLQQHCRLLLGMCCLRVTHKVNTGDTMKL